MDIYTDIVDIYTDFVGSRFFSTSHFHFLLKWYSTVCSDRCNDFKFVLSPFSYTVW